MRFSEQNTGGDQYPGSKDTFSTQGFKPWFVYTAETDSFFDWAKEAKTWWFGCWVEYGIGLPLNPF